MASIGQAGVEECGEEHIAAGAADGLDVGGFHGVRLTGMKRMDGIEFLPSRLSVKGEGRTRGLGHVVAGATDGLDVRDEEDEGWTGLSFYLHAGPVRQGREEGHGTLGHVVAGAADGLDVGGVHGVCFTGMKRMDGMDGIEFLTFRWAGLTGMWSLAKSPRIG